jgi:hypothetical protein
MPVLSLVRENKIQKFTLVERLFYRGSGLVLWLSVVVRLTKSFMPPFRSLPNFVKVPNCRHKVLL